MVLRCGRRTGAIRFRVLRATTHQGFVFLQRFSCGHLRKLLDGKGGGDDESGGESLVVLGQVSSLSFF